MGAVFVIRGPKEPGCYGKAQVQGLVLDGVRGTEAAGSIVRVEEYGQVEGRQGASGGAF